MILNACVHRRHPCLTPLAEGGEIELKYLSKGYTRWPGQGSNPRPLDYEFDTLSTGPLRPWMTYKYQTWLVGILNLWYHPLRLNFHWWEYLFRVFSSELKQTFTSVSRCDESDQFGLTSGQYLSKIWTKRLVLTYNTSYFNNIRHYSFVWSSLMANYHRIP